MIRCVINSVAFLIFIIGTIETETEAICIVDEKTLSIYMAGSEEYFTRLLFKVSLLKLPISVLFNNNNLSLM